MRSSNKIPITQQNPHSPTKSPSQAEDELENTNTQLATALSRIDTLDGEVKDQHALIRKLRGNYETESAMLIGQLQARIEYLENVNNANGGGSGRVGGVGNGGGKVDGKAVGR